MTKEFSSIVELKSIREQKSRLSEREQELSSPILTDFTLIPEIYEWFKELLVHIPEHTRSLSGSLLGYKTIP